MSTRCGIGILNTDNSVESIYCHYDGYPEGVGATLKHSYTNESKIAELIELGDISILDNTIEDTVAYHRDRGESRNNTKANHYESEGQYYEEATDDYGADYLYLFKDGRWFIRRTF